MFVGLCQRAHELVTILGPSAIWCVRIPECVSRGEIGLKVMTLCMMLEGARKEMREILPHPSVLRDEGTVDLVCIHCGERKVRVPKG